MTKLLKGYSILSYFVALIGGFFIGLSVAAITEAGKGQMLAGGAIVLFYGLVGSFIALCLSFFIAFKAGRKVINGMNVFYAIAIVVTILFLRYNKQKRDQERQNAPQEEKTIASYSHSKLLAMLDFKYQQHISITGLGMFKPNIYENKTIYFYGNITEGKSIQEHSPLDSISFIQSENGGFNIVTAPPWLMPDHMKLDYDILYFRVQTIMHDFLEVTVNTTTNKTTFVDTKVGKLMYWPEFFMSVNSVEFPKDSQQKVHARPFENSGTIYKAYDFMKPLKIKQQWMYVELLTDDFQSVGKGWVQWIKNGKLLITYSLLS